LDLLDISLLKISSMVMKLNERKTLLGGLLITLGITVLGGFILTALLMPQCRDVIC